MSMTSKPKFAQQARALPKGFVARAKKTAALAHERKVAKAKELLASIRRRKGEMSGAFWDIGRDLAALRALEVESLLGHRGFFAMCQAECGLSETFVAEALRIATSLSREEAVELGSQKRAAAFLDLARATPEDDTAVGLARRGLSRGRVKLPAGASGTKALAAAKAVRARAPVAGRKAVGRTVTAEERREAARLSKGLRAAGFQAEVLAVATQPGKPCVFTLRLPREAFGALKKLL